jgi:hypothetical protein
LCCGGRKLNLKHNEGKDARGGTVNESVCCGAFVLHGNKDRQSVELGACWSELFDGHSCSHKNVCTFYMPMKTYTEYITGEINIDLSVCKLSSGEREIYRGLKASALFTNGLWNHHRVDILLNLNDFTDSKGRTIGDLLSEHGEDVFKIIDQAEL